HLWHRKLLVLRLPLLNSATKQLGGNRQNDSDDSAQRTDLAFSNRRPRRIPKGFRNEAQGCEERATLGSRVQIDDNPERVVAHGNGSATRPQPRWGSETPATFTQGSSSLATLGFVAESLWDSLRQS